MGISGLLPLLKDIQTNKHLSEFRGQTLAVDGYVWLHRGSYGCAPELATGKKTTKYIEYAMHRVRLLRHHGIQPYLVFDGGPLPAKQGTEVERKQRREENLSRANALAAQGKHSQARDYYVKCVDVTPQMAYQLIKALRAEGVPYVVAPYEADAQLAYLERIGLVDGIITEDSDLLVFGCKTVLFKLDAAANTVTCISRADFASVASTSAGGLSLLGWSDAQFRTMAILSGCDYLPSIPGIGLKTAWTLLRKHKTVENMLSALRLEGKKKIPKGYLDAFRLAEKVFLHQRVYDPTQECLVHLTPLPDGEPWDTEKEAYVGAHIEPSLAKQVAQGDACPISLLPMEDINPSFVPRALKPIPMNSAAPSGVTPGGHRPDKGKGKAKDPARPGPLHKFFFSASSPQVREAAAAGGGHGSGGSASASPSGSGLGVRPAARPASAGAAAMVVGKRSGKRTLADVMEDEMAAKRKRNDGGGSVAAANAAAPVLPARTPATSKFFNLQQRSVSDPRGGRGWAAAARPSTPASSSTASPGAAAAGPSSLPHRGRASEDLRRAGEKENVPCAGALGEDGVDEDGAADIHMADPDAVAQEDGYTSPSPSLAQWDSPDISSPVRPGAKRYRGAAEWEDDDIDIDAKGDNDDDFDADVLSSPPLHRTHRSAAAGPSTVERAITRALPLVRLQAPCFGGGTPGRTSASTSTSTGSGSREGRRRRREDAARGPDLRDAFDDWDEVTSGGEDCGSFAEREDGIASTASSTPGPVTPAEDDGDMDMDMDTGMDSMGRTVNIARADVRALQSVAAEGSSEELEEDEAEGAIDRDCVREAAARNANARVAHGWWAKWARSGPPAQAAGRGGAGGVLGRGGAAAAAAAARGSNSDRQRNTPLRRRETTITPDGRQRPPRPAAAATAGGLVRGVYSAPQLAKRKSLLGQEDLRATGRTKLTFTVEDVRGATPNTGGATSSRPGSASGGSREKEAVTTPVSSRNRLEQFRWTPACR